MRKIRRRANSPRDSAKSLIKKWLLIYAKNLNFRRAGRTGNSADIDFV